MCPEQTAVLLKDKDSRLHHSSSVNYISQQPLLQGAALQPAHSLDGPNQITEAFTLKIEQEAVVLSISSDGKNV